MKKCNGDGMRSQSSKLKKHGFHCAEKQKTNKNKDDGGPFSIGP